MKKLLVLAALLLLVGVGLFAQALTDSHAINFTITEGALLDLSDDSPMGFAIALTAAAGDAGSAPAGTFNATRYLFYTVLSGASDAHISAALNLDMPAGTNLQLISTIAPGGTGTCGATATIADVDNTSQDIVTGIGSCYTSRTAGAGGATAIAYAFTASGYTGTGGETRTLTYTIAVP